MLTSSSFIAILHASISILMKQAERVVYRALVSFRKNSSGSYASSQMEPSKLREAIEHFLVSITIKEGNQWLILKI
jgi:hypothetical protein